MAAIPLGIWGADLKAIEARAEAMGYFTARAEAARETFVMENLDQALQELAAIEDGKERRGGKLPERPLNRTGRRQAGYTEDDIDQVVSWGYAGDDPAPEAGRG